ncbi:MAG: hypothetical protein V1744_03455 [Candidatus Altiarchaeota archaeon]
MNMLVFMAFIFILSFLDIAYTYTNVKILKKHKTNWGDTEYNPLVRASWHHFGLFGGTLFAAALTLMGVLGLAYLIGKNEFFQGMLLGMFLMLHHLHYVNYAYISKKYLKKELPIISRILMEW